MLTTSGTDESPGDHRVQGLYVVVLPLSLDTHARCAIHIALSELPYGWEELQDCEGRFFYIKYVVRSRLLC